MNDHPIQGLMGTVMQSIKDMVDVDTVIGDPIFTSNNVTIIPVSKGNFGFASGGRISPSLKRRRRLPLLLLEAEAARAFLLPRSRFWW